MPYKNPPEIIRDLPKHAQSIWVNAFNSSYSSTQSDSKASIAAWAAVKKARYEKVKGKWKKKNAK